MGVGETFDRKRVRAIISPSGTRLSANFVYSSERGTGY